MLVMTAPLHEQQQYANFNAKLKSVGLCNCSRYDHHNIYNRPMCLWCRPGKETSHLNLWLGIVVAAGAPPLKLRPTPGMRMYIYLIHSVTIENMKCLFVKSIYESILITLFT